MCNLSRGLFLLGSENYRGRGTFMALAMMQGSHSSFVCVMHPACRFHLSLRSCFNPEWPKLSWIFSASGPWLPSVLTAKKASSGSWLACSASTSILVSSSASRLYRARVALSY